MKMLRFLLRNNYLFNYSCIILICTETGTFSLSENLMSEKESKNIFHKQGIAVVYFSSRFKVYLWSQFYSKNNQTFAYVFLCFSDLCKVVLCMLKFCPHFLNLFYFSESKDKYENLREEIQKPLLPGYQNSTCLWVGSEREGNYIILIICFLDLLKFAFCSLEFSTNWYVTVHSFTNVITLMECPEID